MSDDIFNTQHIQISEADVNEDISAVIDDIYFSLKDKGYDPVMQLMGYIISGDPSYITNYNNARKKIKNISQSDLLEYLIRYYFNSKK